MVYFINSLALPVLPLTQFAIPFLLLLLAGSQSVCAQEYPSDQSRFTVNQIRGCAPLNVAITSENIPPGNTNSSIYAFDYQGKINGTISYNRNQDYQDTTYAIPGTYKILWILGSPVDSITIEVLEPRPPQFRVYTCINNSIYIERTGDYYDRLEVDLGNGIRLDVVNSTSYAYAAPGTYTLTVRGLFDNADSQSCAVADTTITTINTLTTASLSAVTVESGSTVRVDYQLPNPDVSYRLEVAEAGSDDFTRAQYNLNDPEGLLITNPALRFAEQSYCFRIVAVNRCDETLNLASNTICSIALRGEAQDQQNQLTWQNSDFSEYQLLRDGEALTTTSDREWVDTDVVCQQDYQYQVRAQNANGTSTSAPLTLTAISEVVSPAPNLITVQPVETQLELTGQLPSGISNYYVYRSQNQDELPAVPYDSARVEDSVAGFIYQDPNVAVGETYCYQVAYVDNCGNESARSAPECATIPTRGELHFPNAFTPNGDGLNDVFVYTARLIERVELRIYNRWGELLFQTNTLEEGWDGTYQGVVVPQGTYLYRADVTDQLGNRFIRQGRLVLLYP